MINEVFYFTILGKLSGTNDITRADRSHWAVGARLRKRDKQIARAAIWEAMVKQDARFTRPVSIKCRWIEPDKRRDLDNITGGIKVILDALVDCKVIEGDSREFVRSISHVFPPIDKRDPRVVVVVRCAESLI